jgi:hypothetical protein
MKRAILAAVACVALLGLGPAAHAYTMEITYDITGSATLGGIGMGTVSGNVGISYSATGTAGQVTSSSGTVLKGPAHLLGGTLSGPISFMFAGDTVTGQLTAIIPGTAPGSLTTAGALSFPAVSLAVNGFIHCSGATCGVVSLPSGVPVNLTSLFHSIVLPVHIPSAAPGSSLQTSFAWSGISLGHIASMPLVLTVTGQEVSRHLVPEPSTLPLLAMGLAGLAAVGTGLRRKRR